MRLFLAIDLPSNIKQQIYTQLDPLRKLYPGFQWVPYENYHITIQFFGEMYAADFIKKKIKEVVFDKKIFYFYSEGIDVFVNGKLVTYLYFSRVKQLELIAEQIKRDISSPSDTPQKYTPHLILARSSLSSKQQYFALKSRLKKYPIETEFPVKKLILFQTVLLNTSSYKSLANFPLLQKSK